MKVVRVEDAGVFAGLAGGCVAEQSWFDDAKPPTSIISVTFKIL